MALRNTDALIIETIGSIAESLPDPIPLQARTHLLVNSGYPGAVVWSSVGALPFFEGGAAVATITVPVGSMKMVQSDGTYWVVTSTSGVTPSTDSGFAVLPGAVALPAAGGFFDSGLSVTLPRAGTYHLDANVRTSISGLVAVNVMVNARLFDVTAAAVVPSSEIVANQLFVTGVAVLTVGNDNTAGIHVEYTVPAAATVRVEFDRVDTVGILTTSNIESDASGRTTLRYQRVHD